MPALVLFLTDTMVWTAAKNRLFRRCMLFDFYFDRSQPRLGPFMLRIYLAFLLVGVFSGSNFIYIKWASPLLSSGQIVLLRVFFGFMPLAILAWRRSLIKLSQIRHLHHFFVMAVTAMCFSYFANAKGTALIPSGSAGVLSGSVPLFASVASCLFLPKERMTLLMVVGVVIGIGSNVLIARPWSSSTVGSPVDPVGAAWVLSSSMVYGLAYVYARKFISTKDTPALAIVTWQMGIALVILLCVTDTSGIGRIGQNWRAALGLSIGLGLLGTGMTFVLYYLVLEKLGAVTAAGAGYLVPAVALVVGWFAGEQIGAPELVAVGMTFCSVVMVEVGRRQSLREKAAINPVPSVRLE